MSFDFPNTPAEGSTYSPAGGPQYIFQNGVWKQVLGGQSPVLTAQSRNRLVNGAMQISQENANTAGTAAVYFPTDQFFVQHGHGGTTTAQRVQSTTPNGSVNRLRFTVTVADAALAASDYAQAAATKIEGTRVADFLYGTASAKQAVLRFGWKSPAGTYGLSVLNSAANRSYIVMFTIAAGQANTDTEQVIVIPGDVTGTWANNTDAGIWLRWAIAAGTSYQGVAGWQAGSPMATSAISNGLATAGAVFEIFDVGLYLDPDRTGVAPPWQMPDEAEELRACQRYWCRQYCSAMCGAAGTYAITPVYFPQRMRVTPAVTTALGGTVANGATVVGDFVSGPEGGYFQLNTSASANANITNRLNNYSARM